MLPSAFSQSKKYGLLTKEGKLAFPIENSSIKRFKNDRVVIKKDGLSTLVNSSGEKIIQESYPEISYFSDKYIMVGESGESGKCGLVDFSGKTIIPIEYDDIKLGDQDFLVAQKDLDDYNRPIGLFDQNGVKVLDCAYEYYTKLPNGNILAVKRSDDNSYMFDKSGALLKIIENCSFMFREPWPYVVMIRDRSSAQIGAFYDFDGKEISPFDMEKFWFLSIGAKYRKGEFYFFLDDNLKEVCKIDGFEIYDIKNDFLFLKNPKKDKYGYANIKGEIIVPVKYDYYKMPALPKDDFSVKQLPVAKEEISKATEKTIPYTETRQVEYKDNLMGVIDANGKELVPYDYTYIEMLPDYFIVGIDIDEEEESGDGSTYCYTAIVQKTSSSFGTTSSHQAAIFVQITITGTPSESDIMSFGREKASSILNGYSISSELLDKNYDCDKCRENAEKVLVLDDYQVLYETME
jgi:hypothetical protein